MQRKKRSILIIVIVIIGVMVVGLSATKIINKTRKNVAADTLENDLGIPTEIMKVTSEELTEKISYIGTIEAKNSVALSSKITSEVIQLSFKEGEIVNKGDVIARLDNSQFEAKLSTTLQKIETMELSYFYLSKEVEDYHEINPAVKRIETVEKNYDYLNGEAEKYKILYENGAISHESYNKVRHEKDMAKMQLEELKATSENNYNKLVHEKNMVEMQLKELYAMVHELTLNLQETIITAPINGRIRMIHYSVGDLAMTGKPLATIDDVGNLVVKTNVGELDLAKIRIGTTTMVNIVGSDTPIAGKIVNIMPSVNPVTRIGEVEISFALEDEEDILIGSSVQVQFVINELKERVVIESSFIKKLEDREIVYVFEDGYVYEREVKAGLVVGDKVQVLEGLEDGENIAYKNLSALYDGAKVYVFQGVDS